MKRSRVRTYSESKFEGLSRQGASLIFNAVTIFLFLWLWGTSGNAQPFEYPTSSAIELRGLKVWPKERIIAARGKVTMQDGLVELLASTPTGKAYESVFALYCNPKLLKASLILIGLNDAGTIENRTKRQLSGDKIYIYVDWTIQNRRVFINAEKTVWDSRKHSPMPQTAWIFSGSRFIKGRSGKKVFSADLLGTLVATYYDPNAIINNPHPERNDDTVYYANKNILPPKGTTVTVVFSAVPIVCGKSSGK